MKKQKSFKDNTEYRYEMRLERVSNGFVIVIGHTRNVARNLDELLFIIKSLITGLENSK